MSAKNDDSVAQLRRRAAASQRLAPLHCGHRDPWTCDCNDQPKPCTDPELLRVVAQHLFAATGGYGTGYDADTARALWRRGGDDARLAERINRFGGVLA